ncbi:receptor-like protein EIX1 [Hevea brasiliensis]|uniref:receptor-like protein EIX1 n=1 Tax=Hevea brasiliensis TaxID=3981 RepID=UPI0025F70FC4|nr:receptor-like protein EIX1 [Hevea brasiliensis]
MFKEGFTNPSDRFSSWVADEACCKWSGVGCQNRTGHLLTLDLHSYNSSEVVQGQLRESLLGLPYLRYIDLSLIDFKQMPIPEFIGSLSKVKYLNLSNANLKGTVPDHLGNLSSLQSLDLSGNSFSLKANNLDWLSCLSSLEVLDLGGVDLSSAVNWLDAMNISLRPYNSFNSPISNWLVESSHTLHYLSLTRCQFHGSIPDAFVNFTLLAVLDFSYNNLHGSIPHNFGNMTSLVVLDLAFNSLEGSVAAILGLIQELQHIKHSPLRELHLSYNKLNGSLERILPQLSELVVLEVASNSLQGLITEVHLRKFSSLRALDLSKTELILNAGSNWIPSFQLETLGLQSCHMGPKFPQWLQNQKKVLKMDISRASISDTTPNWFWDVSLSMKHLNLAHNKLRGRLPDLSPTASLLTLDLSYNLFSGTLPHFLLKMESPVLAGNAFSGPISPICDLLNVNNALRRLDLSENALSGSLPNCRTLFYLNLRHNALSGTIPAWLGESLENLQILLLRDNLFEGNIPLQLCELKYIVILDLSFNSLSGRIPRCINNFLVIAEKEADRSSRYYDYASYAKDEFQKLMWLDSQGIPGEVTELVGLVYLNLSNNQLTGAIPSDIGAIRSLEALDLSKNQLSCAIPTSMSNLSFLAHQKTIKLGGNNKSIEEVERHEFEIPPFYISMGIGFLAGFWGFCGPLLLNASWMHAYFRFVGSMIDQIYVGVVVQWPDYRGSFRVHNHKDLTDGRTQEVRKPVISPEIRAYSFLVKMVMVKDNVTAECI